MSNQLQITGGAKVRNLEGVITGSTGVLSSLPINASNGIPQLDVNGKILVSQLPNSVMEYKGTWNVTTNTPYLVNGTGNTGDVYLVTGAATGGTNHNFGAGNILFYNGDQAIYDGSQWQRGNGATGTVTSVAVTESGDALSITGSPITTSGTINIGFAGTSAQYVAGNGSLITFPTLTGYVPYTGATADVNLGAFDLYTSKVWLYDVPNAGYGSMELTDGVLHFEDVDGHSMVTMEDGYLTIANASTIRALLDVSALSANRDYAFPNASGTLALTSDLSGYVPTSRTISTTSPLSGGGALSSNLTLSISQANTSTNGYLSSTDWNTFNNKQSALTFSSPLVNTSGTISIPVATTSVNGYLSSTDWNTFNNKQNALGFTPIGGSGSINYISKFTGSTTISQSGIYEGVTNYVSIGNINTTYNLDVTGTFRLTSNAIFGGTLGNGTYTYTLPAATGTLALTSQIPSLSGYVTGTAASGQVPYFTGTSSVAGSNNLFWDTSNLRLGIGLNNPQRSLEIYSATADSHLRLSGAAPSVSMGEAITGSVYQAKFGLATASGQYVSGAVAGDFVIISQTGSTIWANSGGERMRLNTNGTFSIGNTNSTYNLDVTGTGRFSGVLNVFSTGSTQLFLKSTGGGSNRDWQFQTNETAAGDLSIMQSTTAGGGTYATKLNIGATGAATFSSSVTANGSSTAWGVTAQFGNSYGNRDVRIGTDATIGENYIQSYVTSTNATRQLSINPYGGNVSIGTSSPISPANSYRYLHIEGGNTTSGGVLYLSTSGAGNSSQIYADTSGLNINTNTSLPIIFNPSGVEKMRITSGGDVGIGNTAFSSTKLTVTGKSTTSSDFSFVANNSANSNLFLVRNDGAVFVSNLGTGLVYSNGSALTSTAPSDKRLKDNITSLSYGLNEILQLRPVSYHWKDDKIKQGVQFGFIAQEVQNVMPEAIKEFGDDIKYLGLEKDAIYAALVNAIQEIVDKYDNKISILEAQIEKLKAKNNG